LHIKAKKYAVHLSDESTRCPFPMNCLCSTCRLTNSGRFVGNPETGDKTSFEDISPLKSASRQRLIGHCWRVSED